MLFPQKLAVFFITNNSVFSFGICYIDKKIIKLVFIMLKLNQFCGMLGFSGYRACFGFLKLCKVAI